jgi:16S rRNA (cytosine967-C5)-methyltransferase
VLLDAERGRGWVRDLLPRARSHLADARDRGLLTELAYGVVRRRGTVDALAAASSRRPLPRLSAAVRTALRLALYQVLFLDRIPTHAAVDHAVSWARRRAGAKAGGYANAVLRAAVARVDAIARGPEDARRDVPREDGSAVRLRDALFPDPAIDPAGNLAARFSMPRWLVARWLAVRGPGRTRAVLLAGISRPPLTLRARGDRDALLDRLRRDGVDCRPGPAPTAILVERRGEAGALRAVEAGEAAVQDATAQRVAPLLAPRAGERLLDLCAAPGGKTLHLADLLEGEGEIVACDVDEQKIATLSGLVGRVRGNVRLGVQAVSREGALPFERASFDGVLVDAPCTNSGVLRRRVEARWRLSPDDPAALAVIQRSLLERAFPLLAPGGRIVYATCSLEREENEDVVRAFLAAHPDLQAAETMEVPPVRDAAGGYAALITKAS